MLNTHFPSNSIPSAVLFYDLPQMPMSYQLKKKKCCKKYKKAGKKRCKNCPNR